MKEINFLPGQAEKNRRGKIQCFLFISAAPFLGFLSVFLLHTVITDQIKQLASYKHGLLAEQSVLSLSEEKVRQLIQESEQLRATLDILQRNRAKIRNVLNLFKDIDSFSSPHFFVRKFEYQAPHLMLSISVDSEKLFLDLVRQIEQKYNQKIRYVVQKGINEKLDFILTMEL